ncbi:MAG TPA: hypothetical protein VGO11_00270 [Chthoniobacteraceae bacterium]|jgi:hypothetical protein|nr:hypothetical protein [Chthoniobacteraceae bacterium]
MSNSAASNSFWLRYHGHVVLVGALINIFGMGLPFIFAPQWFLDTFHLPGRGGSIVWMRQAGLLLSFISTLYIFGGYHLKEYFWNAVFAVGVRMTIGLYWFWLVFFDNRVHSFLIFGTLDVVYGILNAVFLVKAIKALEAGQA